MADPQLPEGFQADSPSGAAGVVPEGFISDRDMTPLPKMNYAIVNGQRVPVEPDQSLLGQAVEFTKGYAEQLNPIPIGQLLPFPQALGGAGLDAPLKAASNILKAQSAVKEAGDAAWSKGDHVEALGHYLNWLLPVIGPVLDKAGTELRTGQWGRALGETFGLGTGFAIPQVLDAAAKAVRPALEPIATAAERGATSRAVETMAPQVGPQKLRLGVKAAEVGPDVLRQTSAITRTGLLDQAESRLADSYAALDQAYDKVPGTRMYPTSPVIKGLQREIDRLSVSGIGGQVEPATRAARIGALRQAISEVKGLGSLMNIDNLRKLRIAWDEGGKGQFAPAVAPDYLKVRGEGSGWADARSVLNNYIVSQHPELSALNADAHLWKTAVDVMQAAEEADQVRPRVGRSIMARGLGAAVGAGAQGTMGAAVGAIVGPSFERVLANLSPTAKILMGRQMANLAAAIRAGNIPRVQSLVASLKAVMKPGVLAAAQAGSESPAQAAPAMSLPALVPVGGQP